MSKEGAYGLLLSFFGLSFLRERRRCSNMVLPEIVASVLEHKYCVIPQFLTPEFLADLQNDYQNSLSDFRVAGVGRGSGFKQEPSVRRDLIYWIDEKTLTQTQLLGQVERLRQIFNEIGYLGLWNFEGHYALYSEGGFYQRHRDSFRSDDSRVVSLVLYLNEEWKPEEGGQLRLYLPNGEVKDVEPTGGTLVCFLSHEIEHEVLTSRAKRKSFACWLKRRPHVV